MEAVATQAAGAGAEVERVLTTLERRDGELAEAMLAAILGEIGAYERPRGGRMLADVREHCRLHVDLLLGTLRRSEGPDRADLEFAREAAARRVRQGIPLDGLLQAFRIGHRTLWQAILDEVEPSRAGREAAITLAGAAMAYIDVASTHVAEAYMRESGQLAELGNRLRRDLLENLLAGRLPDEAETEALGLDIGRDTMLLVAVAAPLAASEADEHALAQAADSLRDGAGSRPLVVVRQGEVVAVMPLPDADLTQARTALERATAGGRQKGVAQVAIGLSSVCRGPAEVAQRYLEAHQALGRTDAERPIVSLSELSPFEHLVAAADRSTRASIRTRAGALTEGRSDVLMRTLRAFLDADLDVASAARALYVHPNTVRYRLRRIGERTGLDPRRFSDQVELLTIARVADACGDAMAIEPEATAVASAPTTRVEVASGQARSV